MQKSISQIAIITLFFILTNFTSYAGDLANDTVWTKRTDELQGFSSVQFIKNDEIIVAQSLPFTYFLDAKDGKELNRIEGKHKPLFFDNDSKFLRLKDDDKLIEVFDANTFELLRVFESDDKYIGAMSISDDKQMLIAEVSNGLRIWNFESGNIIRTKYFDLNDELKSVQIRYIQPINNNLFIGLTIKNYKDKNTNEQYFTKANIVYSNETLDSIGSYGSKGYIFKVSPTKKYIAYGTNGVDIYNLETGEIVSNIQLNSDALTGIEFSNDESFIVTSSTVPANQLAIWDIKTGKQLYEYPIAGYSSLAINQTDNYVIATNGKLLVKYKITDQMLSIEENNTNTILYPNPTNGNLEIKYNVNKPDLFQYEITNINGQLLTRNHLGFKNIGENTDKIELSNIPSGQYNLRLYSLSNQFNFKFIKE